MPNLYESESKTHLVSSDLVVVEPEEGDGGGTARRPNDVAVHVQGDGGSDANAEKLAWHRGLVDMYHQIADGAVAGVSVLQASTAQWGEELGRGLDAAQEGVGKSVGGISGLLLGSGGAGEQEVAVVQAKAKVEQELGLKPGPTIKLHCIDNLGGKFKALELEVKWEESWEDVLRNLKAAFKRHVIFEYEVGGRVIRVQDDQSFDRAMALAEASENKLFVVIQQAVWAEALLEEGEPDEPEPEEEPLIITCADRMAYSPVAYKPLLLAGLLGLALSCVSYPCRCFVSLCNVQPCCIQAPLAGRSVRARAVGRHVCLIHAAVLSRFVLCA